MPPRFPENSKAKAEIIAGGAFAVLAILSLIHSTAIKDFSHPEAFFLFEGAALGLIVASMFD